MRDRRQQQYLEAMGIQAWEPRIPLARPAARVEAAVPASTPPHPESSAPSRERPEVAPTQQAIAEAPPVERPAPPRGEPQPVPAGEPLSWDALRAAVSSCSRCSELAASRTQTVFGVGNPQADWLVIGEAPGAEEDRQGVPFVGRAGKLLDARLAAIALDRGKVYIANVLKCRPPNNRDPRPEEAQNCRPFLQRQIELIAPRLILVVGRIAAQNLLQTDEPLGRLRGKVHTLPDLGIPVVVTYHPAYLLRSPRDKRKAWDDLKLACQVAGSGSD